MKIAFFSDIHANLPALQAVLDDIDQQKPDAVYCLGDLVGYNIWPDEVTEEIRKRHIPTLAGNYDEGIGLHSDDCGCAYKDDVEKANGAVSIAFTNQKVTEKTRTYLRSLPRHLSIEFKFADRNLELLMVHGSPRKINEYLFEDRPEKSLMRILEDSAADILLFGHTHKPFHRKLSNTLEEKEAERHAINIGSVGKPKDGDPRACYLIMEFDTRLETTDPEAIRVTFRRVEYDIEKAAVAVEKSELPNAYAKALREGK
ncbi:metallophosphoesterase family protein [Algoriphagus sp.]|uniref:metallophosphoesterase family protein n=1 Tax=Algoriphagus sp. TaxID=1872435 RepID=UPI00326B8AD5